MKSILFLTEGNIKSATNRLWFYQMSKFIDSEGYNVSFNSFETAKIDFIIINRLNPKLFYEAYKNYPDAVIGALITETNPKRDLLKYCDFAFVHSFLMSELIEPFDGQIFYRYDFENVDLNNLKKHKNSNPIIVGYHGTLHHYQRNIVGFLDEILLNISKKYNVLFRVICNDAHKLNQINGLESEFIEWELDRFESTIKTFDIGLCPSYKNLEQHSDPFISFRDSNRVRTLLAHGIPSVCSPLFESCWQLENNIHALFAISPYSWKKKLIDLIISSKERNRIGKNGFNLIKEKYSTKVAINNFKNMVENAKKNKISVKDRSLNDLEKINQLYKEENKKMNEKTIFQHMRYKIGRIRKKYKNAD